MRRERLSGTDVVEPVDLAVGGIKERHVEAVEVEGIVGGAAGVALRLGKHVLRAKADFSRFDDAEELARAGERVVGGPVVRFEFRDGVARVAVYRLSSLKRDDLPALATEARVDAFAARAIFGLVFGVGHGANAASGESSRREERASAAKFLNFPW